MTKLHFLGRIIPARSSRSRLWAVLSVLAAVAAASGLRAQTLESLARAYRENPTPTHHAALAAFAGAHQKDAQGALALLVLGVVDQTHGKQSEAVGHFTAAGARLPKLADYAGAWTAQAQFELRNFSYTIRALEPVWNASPLSPMTGRAAMVAARANLEAGSPAEAVRVLKQHSQLLWQPAGDTLLAQALEASGDSGAAAAAWQRVYFDYPASEEASQAETAMARLKSTLGDAYPPVMPSQMLSRAERLISSRQYRQARNYLESVLSQLGGADHERARVLIGAAGYLGNDSTSAHQYLGSLQLQPGEADAERLYYLVAASRRLDRDADLQDALSRLAKLYPVSPWRRKALMTAADRLLLENRPDEYTPLYTACFESFPADPESWYCHWKVAWSAYLRRRPNAVILLRDHIAKYPSSEKAGAAMYYLGRMAERENDFSGARTWYDEIVTHYPNYFYAMLARDRLADKRVAAAPRAPAVNAFLLGVKFPPRMRRPDFDPDEATLARLERSRLLRSAGLDDYAETELRFGAKNDAQPHLLAMELAQMAVRRGYPDQGIRYIKSLAPGYLFIPLDAAPDKFWRLAFPMPYRSDIERSAKANALDPYLVAALIRQESEFNPKALSPANARGLTQVVPSTGRQLARGAGTGRVSPASLYQPSVNLKLGTYYLRRLLDELGGKWEATLASYNAGKSRVVNWLTWSDFREPAEFVETIPFTETRNYVQYIMRNADVYRKLYAGRPVTVEAEEPAPVKVASKKATPAKKKTTSSRKKTRRKKQ